ncbi:complex I subunit 5 family protein [Hoyosella subflava]|uniref:Formate hydrogenlyase subunit 3/multisubunit Na+/H+ antiporter, MnhD subunit n=1 Tax=Hoyosella subflava (strain DSM 45089 / JCM 17490 / NBRC 109087 / DQS3-9A1) TaxID=443218 RepID=F6EIU0_HOYSD|nr:proton-conducting transporter membrane subunit [Hoyosella subflava]AEF40001.1 Formate hydrogenlyase subunit 3/multisubunit Na+/H+ antiporter, MnhD subunit [Hoyosella subflava DQS3-9A1]
MANLLPVVVLLPLVGAILTSLTTHLGPRRLTPLISTVTTALVLAAGCAVAFQVGSSGPLMLVLGGWETPVAIALMSDGFSAAMLLMTAGVGLVVCVFASATPEITGGYWFWPLWLFLLAGLNAVYVSADLFNTYVALELLTVAAVALVALGGRAALLPALRYLLIAVLGSLLFLLGVALVYAETGTLATFGAAEETTGGLVLLVALGVMTLGLAIKVALFPLHSWLPPAHAGAPAAVSPLMSALVIKAAFFVLARMWINLSQGSAPTELAYVLGAVGSVAALWGAALALRQSKLKRVVAYSTVAQVGYFFLLFPLVIAGDGAASALAWEGALVFLFAHGLAKAAMFMAAGSFAHAHGTDELEQLRGAAARMPVASMSMAIAGVSLAGLPPTLAFVGKWQLLHASIESGQWWWIPVLLIGGLLTFAYTARVLRILLDTEDADDQQAKVEQGKFTTVRTDYHPIPQRMQYPALLLAVLTIVLGLRSIDLTELLQAGAAMGGL